MLGKLNCNTSQKSDLLITVTEDEDLDLADLSGRSVEEICFCCTVRLKCSQLIRELSVVDDSKKEFTSRMSLEWSFLFLDHRYALLSCLHVSVYKTSNTICKVTY